jgi:hypothetical protein
MPALRRQMLEAGDFKASLSYIVRLYLIAKCVCI